MILVGMRRCSGHRSSLKANLIKLDHVSELLMICILISLVNLLTHLMLRCSTNAAGVGRGLLDVHLVLRLHKLEEPLKSMLEQVRDGPLVVQDEGRLHEAILVVLDELTEVDH